MATLPPPYTYPSENRRPCDDLLPRRYLAPMEGVDFEVDDELVPFEEGHPYHGR